MCNDAIDSYMGKTYKRRPTYTMYSVLFYPITLEGRRGTTDEFAMY